MELTHEQRCQIAALSAQGKTAEECAKLAGADLTKTILFLESREKGNKKEYVKLTPELKYDIIKLHKQGYSMQGIANRTNVSKSNCQRVVSEYKEIKSKPSQINKDFEKATDKLIEEMRAEKPSEKENEPASAATDNKPITSKMEERHTLSIPQNDNNCQDLIDEVIKDLVKISNWCCTEGNESESDYVRTLGFIQGFTEALVDKYRNKIRRLNNDVD